MKEEKLFPSYLISFCLHAGLLVFVLAYSFFAPSGPLIDPNAIEISYVDDGIFVTARGDGKEGDGGNFAPKELPGPISEPGPAVGPLASNDVPAKSEPDTPADVKADPVKEEPAKADPVETAPVKSEPDAIEVPEDPTKKPKDDVKKDEPKDVKPKDTTTPKDTKKDDPAKKDPKKTDSLKAGLADMQKKATARDSDTGKKDTGGNSLGDALKDMQAQAGNNGAGGGVEYGQAGGTGLPGAGGVPGTGVPGGTGGRPGRPGTGGIGGGSSVGRLGSYAEHIVSKVKPNFHWPSERADRKRFQTRVRLHIAESGQLLETEIIQSSGEPAFDAVVQYAIEKAGTFEQPITPEDRQIEILFTSEMASGA